MLLTAEVWSGAGGGAGCFSKTKCVGVTCPQSPTLETTCMRRLRLNSTLTLTLDSRLFFTHAIKVQWVQLHTSPPQRKARVFTKSQKWRLQSQTTSITVRHTAASTSTVSYQIILLPQNQTITKEGSSLTSACKKISCSKSKNKNNKKTQDSKSFQARFFPSP